MTFYLKFLSLKSRLGNHPQNIFLITLLFQLYLAVVLARMSVDQLSVDKALEVLSHRTDRMFDAPVGVVELSDYLVVLCGHLQTQRINAALTVDLLLNWLLNVYDKLATATVSNSSEQLLLGLLK